MKKVEFTYLVSEAYGSAGIKRDKYDIQIMKAVLRSGQQIIH